MLFLTSISPNGKWIAGWGNSGSIGNTVSWFVEIPLSTDCDADIDGSNAVDVSDLLMIIDQWGAINSPADVNNDGIVDVSDLLIAISSWGPCE